MRPIATDGVALSVCLSVRHSRSWALYKNGWTDRDAVRRADSLGPKKSCIRWGPDTTTGRGNFGGCLLKITGSFRCSVRSKNTIQSSRDSIWHCDAVKFLSVDENISVAEGSPATPNPWIFSSRKGHAYTVYNKLMRQTIRTGQFSQHRWQRRANESYKKQQKVILTVVGVKIDQHEARLVQKTTRRAVSVEILSTAAKLYEKSLLLKRMAIDEQLGK